MRKALISFLFVVFVFSSVYGTDAVNRNLIANSRSLEVSLVTDGLISCKFSSLQTEGLSRKPSYESFLTFPVFQDDVELSPIEGIDKDVTFDFKFFIFNNTKQPVTIRFRCTPLINPTYRRPEQALHYYFKVGKNKEQQVYDTASRADFLSMTCSEFSDQIYLKWYTLAFGYHDINDVLDTGFSGDYYGTITFEVLGI